MFFLKLNYISLEIFNDKLRERDLTSGIFQLVSFFILLIAILLSRETNPYEHYIFFRDSFHSGSFPIIHLVKK